MRNLKRVLSLALASIMLLGMMVIGASAADIKASDLKDISDVKNKEAVNLMVDLGVIVGKPDGTYAPTEGVDRATMANLICRILMGETDPALFEGTTTDLKDIDSSWAKGYIKYCYANGIISGDGKGSFFPTQGVTVVQAAKMLLVALGYDATAEKYENDGSWSVNIMRDAKTAGLLNNLDAKTNDALTRDGAAQMIFNALFAYTQKYKTQYDQGNPYKTDRESTGSTLGEITYDLYKVTALVKGINSKGMLVLDTPVAASDKATSTDAASYVDEKLPGTPDMVGSVVSIYVKGSIDSSKALKVSEMYSTAASLSTANVAATNYGLKSNTTASKSGTAALTALLVTDSSKVASLESGKTINDLKVYYNGESKGTVADNDGSIARIGKFGVITEFKNTNNIAGVDTVVITEKKVATLGAAPVVSGDTVTISSLGIAKVNTSKVVGYEDLAKGDVVLYVQMGGMTYIEKAEVVEGIATGNHNTKGLLVDGTYYLTSDLTGKSNDWSSDYTNTYKFYLDNGKHIVKAVKVTDEETSGSYAVLTDIALVKTSGVNGTHYVEGKLVKTDGTSEVVKIASIDGVKVVLDGKAVAADLYKYKADNDAEAATGEYAKTLFYYTKDNNNKYAAKYFAADGTSDLTAASVGMDANKTATTDPYAVKGQIYEYTVNSDSEYVLSTKLSNKATYGNLANTSIITNNKAAFNGSNIGNSSTIFLYETTDGNGKVSYTVYTGIADVPTTNGNVINGNGTNKNIVKNSAGVAVFVYAQVGGTTLSSNDYVYFYNTTNFTSGKDGSTDFRIYDAIVNGEKTTIKVDGVGTNVTPGLHSITAISEKGINTISAELSAQKYTGVISTVGGTLVTDTSSAKAFTAEDADIYYVDGKNNASTATLDSLVPNAYDTVYVIETAGGSGVAKIVYVIHQDPALTTLTLEGGSSNGVTTLTDDALADGKGEISVTDSFYTVKIDAANIVSKSGTTVKLDDSNVKVVTINDVTYTPGTDYEVVKGVVTLTIKVVVVDNMNNSEDVITATVTVNNSRA